MKEKENNIFDFPDDNKTNSKAEENENIKENNIFDFPDDNKITNNKAEENENKKEEDKSPLNNSNEENNEKDYGDDYLMEKDYDNLNVDDYNTFRVNDDSKNNEISIGEFEVMEDNTEEYRKSKIESARQKIWKVVKKIKESKNDIEKIMNDPSQKKWYVINPTENKFTKVFECIICLVLYLDFFISPFEFFVYSIHPFKEIRIIIFDIILLIEIIITFFTAYYDSKNKYYVTDTKKIAIHYLKYGFIPNFLYIFPFYLFYSTLEVIRLIKLYRYPYVNSKIKQSLTWLISFCTTNITFTYNFVRVFTFFLSLCYVLHFCACIYCYLGMKYSVTWIYDNPGYFENYSITEIYVSAFYFITETYTSTGYGDLTPKNDIEVLFIMFCEIINCGLYAYLLSNILDILTNIDISSKGMKYRVNQSNLQNWISFYMNKLPSSSRKSNLHRNAIWNEIKNFYNMYHDKKVNYNWIQDKNFINQMKPSQKNEILSKVFDNFINKFSAFFSEISKKSTTFKIIMNLKTSIETSNTVLIPEGNRIKKIFFIEKGEVALIRNGKIINTIKEGQFFGMEGILTTQNKSEISYVVYEECPYTVLYSIKIKFLLEEILNYDGESLLRIMNITKRYMANVADFCGIENIDNEIGVVENKNVDDDGNEIINEDYLQTQKEKKLKLNANLMYAGSLPSLTEKLKEYQRAEKIIDESNLRLDLISDQINFINTYLDKVIEQK